VDPLLYLAEHQKGEIKVVFTEPGTYDYICSIHPSMRGNVILWKRNETSQTGSYIIQNSYFRIKQSTENIKKRFFFF
jgi:hypothetical protein